MTTKKVKQTSFDEFKERFPDNKSCLDYIIEKKYKGKFGCPDCSNSKTWWEPKRGRYVCNRCGKGLSPLKDTIFFNSSLPLQTWFFAIWIFSNSKNGVSAKEIERHLGITYQTAWRMMHKIRVLMVDDPNFSNADIVEIDEAFVGGKNKNRHENKQIENDQGRSLKGKEGVVGFYDRKSKKVRTLHFKKATKILGKEIRKEMRKFFGKDTVFYTDEAKYYISLRKEGFLHKSVNHSAKIFVIEDNIHTNSIESFWAVLKRTIRGSYIHVSTKWFTSYLNEVVFKFNNRNDVVFNEILNMI
jgi:transposase